MLTARHQPPGTRGGGQGTCLGASGGKVALLTLDFNQLGFSGALLQPRTLARGGYYRSARARLGSGKGGQSPWQASSASSWTPLWNKAACLHARQLCPRAVVTVLRGSRGLCGLTEASPLCRGAPDPCWSAPSTCWETGLPVPFACALTAVEAASCP